MRTNRPIRVTLLATLSVAGALALPAAAPAATIANGNFETGDLSGWTTSESGSGSWTNYTGTTAPSGLVVGAPPEGTRGAVTSQGGPGSHLLYQDVALEAGSTHTLKLWVYWQNNASFVTRSPATLSQTGGANQQLRIDVMSPSASVTSVDPADILASVSQTQPGDPGTQAPTEISADLSAFAGQTVRLRVAEVDNANFFSAAIDDVRVESTPLPVAAPAPAPVPAPEPVVEPTPAAAPTAAPAAVAPCVSRRSFTIHLRPGYANLVSAAITLNDKTVKVGHDKRLTAKVNLRGLPKATYKLAIDTRDARGRHYREVRRYKTCARARPARGAA